MRPPRVVAAVAAAAAAALVVLATAAPAPVIAAVADGATAASASAAVTEAAACESGEGVVSVRAPILSPDDASPSPFPTEDLLIVSGDVRPHDVTGTFVLLRDGGSPPSPVANGSCPVAVRHTNFAHAPDVEGLVGVFHQWVGVDVGPLPPGGGSAFGGTTPTYGCIRDDGELTYLALWPAAMAASSMDPWDVALRSAGADYLSGWSYGGARPPALAPLDCGPVGWVKTARTFVFREEGDLSLPLGDSPDGRNGGRGRTVKLPGGRRYLVIRTPLTETPRAWSVCAYEAPRDGGDPAREVSVPNFGSGERVLSLLPPPPIVAVETPPPASPVRSVAPTASPPGTAAGSPRPPPSAATVASPTAVASPSLAPVIPTTGALGGTGASSTTVPISASTPAASTSTEDAESLTGGGDGNRNDVNSGDGGDDNDSACFPATARVRLASGADVTVADLRVGDVAAAAPGIGGGPSEVYAFSHADAHVTSQFVRLVTAVQEEENGRGDSNATTCGVGATAAVAPVSLGTSGSDRRRPLVLSPGHYLWVNGRLAAAHTVLMGDTLTAADGSVAVVTGVSRITSVGLYNPHTLGGSLVVEGIAVSCYTTAVRVGVADALLTPVRAAYHVGVRGWGAGVLSSMSGLAWLVPSGPAVVT
ncbi:hypothetical protein MMPV_003058 [Pyropia vietnamensis]